MYVCMYVYIYIYIPIITKSVFLCSKQHVWQHPRQQFSSVSPTRRAGAARVTQARAGSTSKRLDCHLVPRTAGSNDYYYCYYYY